jgi:hypothetical protein
LWSKLWSERKKRKKIEPYEMAAAIVLKVHIQS